MNMLKLLSLTVLIVISTAANLDKDFWYNNNDKELSDALNRQKLNTNTAKNIILVIGDGMGVTTTTATRILRGQRSPTMLGEEALLTWDKFPFTGLSKTYSTDVMTTDSAASATAYHCGVKTIFEAVGVDNTVKVNDCPSVENAKVGSVLDWSLESGKSVGIVTTDSLVGASPSAAYAHAAYRNWRDDTELPENANGVCKDIARQLIEDNLNIQVMLGGGRKHFIPRDESDPEYTNLKGQRTDGKNLFQIWEYSQKRLNRTAKVVYTKEQFDNVNPDDTQYLLGSFEQSRLMEETERRVNNSEPSLTNLTDKAIRILSKNDKGFYLFIEGANIDMGHHENRAKKALEESLALDDAVKRILELTNADETLVIVSADHSHAFSFGGYSNRGQSILSVSNSRNSGYNEDLDGNKFTILSYGNGPGYKTAQRANLTDDYFSEDRVYMSNFPLAYETHGGEDVAIYASGPMAHIFTGTHEQTFIAHGMAYAACIGRNKGHCNQSETTSASHKQTNQLHYSLPLILVALKTIFF